MRLGIIMRVILPCLYTRLYWGVGNMGNIGYKGLVMITCLIFKMMKVDNSLDGC